VAKSKKPSRSRTRASAGRAKSTKKSARTSGVKRTTTSRALTAPVAPKGINIKKLKKDLEGAIVKLRQRADRGDTTRGLSETQDVFRRWVMDIDSTVCTGADGPCGDTMLIGS